MAAPILAAVEGGIPAARKNGGCGRWLVYESRGFKHRLDGEKAAQRIAKVLSTPLGVVSVMVPLLLAAGVKAAAALSAIGCDIIKTGAEPDSLLGATIKVIADLGGTGKHSQKQRDSNRTHR